MPHKKSAKKRLRQNLKRRERNVSAKHRMKTAIKYVKEALNSGADPEKINELLRNAVSIINKTAQKGIIHDNKAARLTSRLTRKVNEFLTSNRTPQTS